MQEIVNSIIEQFNNHKIDLDRLVVLQLVIGLALLVYYIVGKRILQYLFKKNTIDEKARRKLRNIVRLCFFLLTLLLAIILLGLNIGIPNEHSTLNIANILLALLIFQIARLFDYLFGRIVQGYYDNLENNKEKKNLNSYTNARPQQMASNTLKYAIYTFAAILILKNFAIDYELFSFQAGGNDYIFRVSSIFSAILILLLARLLTWFSTQIFLSSYYRSKDIDLGSQFAINQLISYFIYTVAVVMALDNMGVQMTVLWGGLAALLVGVGLGLQQTFNDLFSGILLLFERTIEVGDVVEIDGSVGTVKEIGLRTSKVESREHVTLIIPNSKLVMDSIVNWKHVDAKVRFDVSVGVAYGSDTALVRELLLQAAKHPNILEWPVPFVRFANFGDSSLDFELLFFSTHFININDIKSDVRFKIDQLFREHNVQIPFPQRDIWLKGN